MPHLRPAGIETVKDALLQLREMQAQIIHGTNVFGEIADLMEAVYNENERIVSEAKKCYSRNDELVRERLGLKRALEGCISAINRGEVCDGSRLDMARKEALSALGREF